MFNSWLDLRLILMRLHSPVDLTGDVIVIEELVFGGTWTGDLPPCIIKRRYDLLTFIKRL